MRSVLPFLAAAFLAFAAPPGAAQEALRVELNAIETVQDRCQLSFVIENKGPSAIDTLTLDLALFNPDGIVQRRLAVELGPVRRAKTIVKSFAVDGECGQIGSILVNDVTACTPLDAGACLDQLTLSSRPKNVRFYK